MKKFISLIICILLLSTTVIASPVYEYKTQEKLYSGITHTSYRRLYSDRDVTFNVVKVDLNKSFLKLDLLKSPQGTDILDTVKNLAATQNTIVAANADFFSVHSGNKGFSLGPEIKDGKLLQSPINTDEMAAGFIEDNTLMLSYMTFTRKVVAPNGESLEIRHTNKHTTYYGSLLLYTSDFNNGMSPAPGEEVVEMVVEDGKVKEFRRNLPSVAIPENGYVLVVSEGSSMFLANNFKVGDEVKLELSATPSLDNIKTAFGGGTMLIKNGEIAPITHNISGYNPRTAIGTDKTGKFVYLVTVDGRTSSSKGATLSQLAEIMMEFGCYNALNLDGGGSTNLVAKTAFNSDLHSLNTPTENRKVVNALGVISSAHQSKPTSVQLNISSDVTFVDDYITYEARIFDEYLNPVWNGETATVTASSGKIEKPKFFPSKGGEVVLTAQYKDFSTTKKITVIDSISTIKLNDTLNLKKGKTAQLSIEVSDIKGNTCKVDNFANFKITSLNPQIATYSNKTITAKNSGVTHIKVEKGNAVSYLKIVVDNPQISAFTDNFETINATFTSYPDEHAKGSYSLSTAYKKSGKYSGKLSFDFTTEEYDDTMAAYMVFDSIQMSDNIKSLTFDMYSEEDFDELLIKIQFTDGKGNKAYRLTPLKGVKKGWQTVETVIPDDAIFPLYLTRIYVVQEKETAKNKGDLYFDNLKVNISSNPIININKDFNTVNDTNYGVNSKGTIIKIAGIPDSQTSIFDNIAYSNLLKSISSANSYALLGKYNNSKINSSYSQINTQEFSHITKDGADFITVVTKNGSIRSADASQWTKFKDALKNCKENNLFILVNGTLKSDTIEGSSFLDMLNDLNTNVYVVTNAPQTSYHKYKSVNIFGISDTTDGVNLDDKMANANILEFNINNDKVTYEFKKLWN